MDLIQFLWISERHFDSKVLEEFCIHALENTASKDETSSQKLHHSYPKSKGNESAALAIAVYRNDKPIFELLAE